MPLITVQVLPNSENKSDSFTIKCAIKNIISCGIKFYICTFINKKIFIVVLKAASQIKI